MHKEVLSNKQIELLPLMKKFKREFFLVGGTAIALHIGHRRSIDFDLFKTAPLNHKKNLDKLDAFDYQYTITRRVSDQMNLILNGVKITFFQYPFEIFAQDKYEVFFRLPSLMDLAAMKAYALGRRSKWKDYVDLYFLLNEYFTIEEISQRANELFGNLFSEKLFRSQLCYFDDVDYSEQVEYIINDFPTENHIKHYLTRMAVQI